MELNNKVYILFDTEFTAWKGSQENNWSKPNEHRELVQLVAYKIYKGKIIKKLGYYIRPTINKVLSKYFTNLTGITNYKIQKNGIHPEMALCKFYEFTKHCKYVYSYGNDWPVLKENLILNNMFKGKFILWEKKFYDFKNLIKQYSNVNTKNYSSGTIHKAFGITLSGKHHNAEYDVQSLYLTLNKLLLQ